MPGYLNCIGHAALYYSTAGFSGRKKILVNRPNLANRSEHIEKVGARSKYHKDFGTGLMVGYNNSQLIKPWGDCRFLFFNFFPLRAQMILLCVFMLMNYDVSSLSQQKKH